MKILCIGGDARMLYAADYLSAERLFMGNFPEPAGKFEAIVLPVPLTKDGAGINAPLAKTSVTFNIILQYAEKNAHIFAGGSCEKLENLCRENGFELVNYFEIERLVLKNAALTAEAAVSILSQNGDGALLGAKVLITGYGRIARFLGKYLSVLGAEVTIAARNPAARAAAELCGFRAVDISEIDGNYEYCANTVPAHILPEDFFGSISGYMELATLDGSREKQLCAENGIKYIAAGGLPGKYYPKTAGKFIAEEINRLIDYR